MNFVKNLAPVIVCSSIAMPGIAADGGSSNIRDEMVRVGNHRLHFRVGESGTPDASKPVIVLESGGGLFSTQWSDLQPELVARTGTTVVAYDRAGFGESDLPDSEYDIGREVSELHGALVELGFANRSMILVAHSYGALLAQIYANRWPQTVTGMVLLDPNSPAAMLALGQDSGIRPPMENPQTKRQRAFARIDSTGWKPFADVYLAPLPIDVPVMVLSSEKDLFPSPRANDVFRISHQLLARSVSSGRVVVAMGCGHNIPVDCPDLVLEAVKELLASPQRLDRQSRG